MLPQAPDVSRIDPVGPRPGHVAGPGPGPGSGPVIV